jgi:hypothetical protein
VGIIDEYTEITSEADYEKLKKELPINIELRKEQEISLQEKDFPKEFIDIVLVPLDMVIEGTQKSISDWEAK